MAGSGPNSAVAKWPRIQLDLPLSFLIFGQKFANEICKFCKTNIGSYPNLGTASSSQDSTKGIS